VGILNTLEDCGGMGTAQERDVNFLAQIHQKFGGVQNGMMSTTKRRRRSPTVPFRKSRRGMIILSHRNSVRDIVVLAGKMT
jgi:hypothetical protein